MLCEEWKEFKTFYDWAISNGYADNLTIDRKDTNGNYCPDNCHWIPREEQSKNRRNVVLLTYNGETMSCAEWSRKLGLYPGTVNNRLHKGYTVEECLFGKRETMHKITNIDVRQKIQEINLRK